MGQPIEERRRHLRVTKDVSPFTEAQIGCDDDTGALIEAAEQMEQQGAPVPGSRHESVLYVRLE